LVALLLPISHGGGLVSLCSSTLGVQLFPTPCIFSLFSPNFRPLGALVLQLKSLIVEKLRASRIGAIDVLAIRADDPNPGLLSEGGQRNHYQPRNQRYAKEVHCGYSPEDMGIFPRPERAQGLFAILQNRSEQHFQSGLNTRSTWRFNAGMTPILGGLAQR
jgi:hypothetical protein